MGSLLTLKEVADICSCSTTTLRTKIKNGELKAVRWSQTDFRVDKDDLEAFIEERKVNSSMSKTT